MALDMAIPAQCPQVDHILRSPGPERADMVALQTARASATDATPAVPLEDFAPPPIPSRAPATKPRQSRSEERERPVRVSAF